MPKSDVERQRECRARKKNDPETYELYKEADRTRKKLTRESMSDEELDALRKQSRDAVRRHREKKKAKIAENSENQTVGQENQDKQTTNTGGYKSTHTLGRAKRRAVENLPRSPEKKRQVVHKMAEEILQVKLPFPQNSQKKQAGMPLATTTTNAIEAFYGSDSVSRIMPGKADYKVIKRNGEKVKKQIRVMIMTIKEAHSLFIQENPTMSVSLSKFADLREDHILLVSKMPHNVCACRYHSDIILLLESLHRKFPLTFPLYTRKDFVEQVVCDPDSEDCMVNDCPNCKDGQLFYLNFKLPPEYLDEKVSFSQWEEVEGYITRVSNRATVREVQEILLGKLPRFLWHHFVKRKQSESYERDKMTAKDESRPTECTLQMDFSENFTIIQQQEIQSANWKKKYISLYTVVVWYGNVCISWVIVSDELCHDKKSVMAYTHTVIEKIKKDFPSITTVRIWTDGPSSQYKSKYVASSIPTLERMFGIKVIWNFSATGHGKGPVDGIGGTAKRVVHLRILAGTATNVTDAESFAKCFREADPSILCSVLSPDEIDRKSHFYEENVWPVAPAIKGIQNMHYITTNGNSNLFCKFYEQATEGRLVILPDIPPPQSGVMDEPMVEDATDIPMITELMHMIGTSGLQAQDCHVQQDTGVTENITGDTSEVDDPVHLQSKAKSTEEEKRQQKNKVCTEGENPQQRNTEGENPQQRNTEGEKPEQRNTEGKKPEQRNTEGEKPEQRNTEGEKPQQRNTEGEKPQQRNTEGEKPQQRNIDGEKPQQKNTEGEKGQQRNIEEEKRQKKNTGKKPQQRNKSTKQPIPHVIKAQQRVRRRRNQRVTSKTPVWQCKICSVVYGDKADKRLQDDWLVCTTCSSKFHETCAEQHGVIDDGDVFTCQDCM